MVSCFLKGWLAAVLFDGAHHFGENFGDDIVASEGINRSRGLWPVRHRPIVLCFSWRGRAGEVWAQFGIGRHISTRCDTATAHEMWSRALSHHDTGCPPLVVLGAEVFEVFAGLPGARLQTVQVDVRDGRWVVSRGICRRDFEWRF